MNTHNHPTAADVSRRAFIQKSSLAVAGALTTMRAPFVHAAGSDAPAGVKIGVIGCGGRGTGAMLNAIGAAVNIIYPESGYHTEDVADDAKVEKKDIEVVALADLFEDRLKSCHRNLTN
jgi:hypothetical protein